MTFFQELATNFKRNLLAKNPCVCIAAMYILGILLYKIVRIEGSITYFFLILFVSASTCIALSHIYKSNHLLFLFSWFIFAGYCFSALHEQQYSSIITSDWVEGKIIENLEEKPKSFKTKIETNDNGKTYNAILYIQKDSLSQTLCYGDIIRIKNNFKQIENQENSTFDYKGFLANQYIYNQAYIKAHQWEKIGHKESLFSVCMRIRNTALNTLHANGLTDSNLQLIAALAFGDKSLLDEETKGNFQTAGAMHILAVSGLHVGIVNGILFFVFGFIRKKEHLWIKILCCISGIWAYACLTGMSPSVQRAAIMCSMVSISLILKRNCSTYNSLAAAALISLLTSPNDLFSVSFQLSYIAVLSIVYFGQKIQNLANPETIIGGYIWGIIAVSIAVQIGTMPITLFYFGAIPTYSLLTNIVVIPLSFIIVLCVVFSLATSWFTIVTNCITQILNFFTSYLQDAIADINTFPHPQINFPIDITQSIVCYCIIIIIIGVIEVYSTRKVINN